MEQEKILEEQKKLKEADSFFEAFEFMKDGAFGKGAIPKKYKELIGLAIAITSKSDEAIILHLNNCIDVECSKQEIVEVIKVAVASGGSILLPWAARAFSICESAGME